MPRREKMKMDRNTNMYKYISALRELTRAFKITDMVFMALKSLVILSTLKILNILMDLKAEIAPPPPARIYSTMESKTMVPSK
jgi:hypothetical protein